MIANIALGVVGYIVGVLFLARLASHRWHPDKGGAVWCTDADHLHDDYECCECGGNHCCGICPVFA
jgi:hypothetical protein